MRRIVGVMTTTLSAMALFLACSSARSELTPKQRYDALSGEMVAAQESGHETTIIAVERAYGRLFPDVVRDGIISKADPDGVVMLFRAAELTAWHTLEPRHVNDMRRAFEALSIANAASPEQARELRDLMLKARMFDGAGLPPGLRLPHLRDEASGIGPSELALDENSDILIRRAIPMTNAHVVVVSAPRCHWSADARREIGSDPVLAPIFVRHARWLVPQEATPSLDLLREKNAANPELQYTLAYRRSEFPMFDSWATPTFYFLRGSVVVAKVVGWPRGGRVQEVAAGLRAIGLLDP